MNSQNSDDSADERNGVGNEETQATNGTSDSDLDSASASEGSDEDEDSDFDGGIPNGDRGIEITSEVSINPFLR